MSIKIIQTVQSVRKAFTMYPLMLISAFTLMISVIFLIENDAENQFTIVKTSFTTGLGISLFFALAIIGQRFQKSWLGNILGLLFLVIFYFFILPSNESDFNEKYIFILTPIFILSHLGVAIAAYFSNKQDEANFWSYNKTLFINTFLTLVFSLVLAGGVLLAMLAMDHLFTINWRGEIYAEVFFAIMIFGSNFIFSLFHLEGLPKMEEATPYPTIIQFFTQFILIPLLILYVCILYIYGIKIIIDWEIPSGWVSYLVLAYAVLGILALLLVHPLLEGENSKSWVKWFRNIFYFTLIPLLVLLFTAIGIRVEHYGITEARYFVLLLAFWLSVVSFYFIFAPKPLLKFIPISLFLLAGTMLVLPYFNPLSVSIRSQKAEVNKILHTHDLLDNGIINFSKPTSYRTAEELRDKINYLQIRNQEKFFINFLDSNDYKTVTSKNQNIRNLFTNLTFDSTENHHRYLTIKTRDMLGYDIEGYTNLVTLRYENSQSIRIDSDTLFVQKSLYESPQILSITHGEDSINLIPLIEEWASAFETRSNEMEVDKIEIPFVFGDFRGKMLFDQITVSYKNVYQKKTYQFDWITLLFRREEQNE